MDATQGLRLDAARPTALASMGAAEILAGLSDETRAELTASLAAAPTPDDDEVDSTDQPVDDDEGDKEPDKKADADAATARMTAVFASDAAKGREAQAAKLLGNADLAALSADAIIGLLADMPVATQSADDGAAAVLAAITANNANLGAGGNTDSKPAAENHGWADVIASVQATFS